VVNARRSHAPLLLLLPLACVAEDPGSGSTTSGAPSSATTAETTTTSATTAVATTTSGADGGSTSLVGTTGESDTTQGGDGPPIFDLAVPDVPKDGPLTPTDIDVVITADNAYAFGYGTENEMSNYFGGVMALLAGEIFNCNGGPEQYLVPAEDVA
jgi:hypothetical protein